MRYYVYLAMIRVAGEAQKVDLIPHDIDEVSLRLCRVNDVVGYVDVVIVGYVVGYVDDIVVNDVVNDDIVVNDVVNGDIVVNDVVNIIVVVDDVGCVDDLLFSQYILKLYSLSSSSTLGKGVVDKLEFDAGTKTDSPSRSL